MSDDNIAGDLAELVSPRERAQAVAKTLSEAARRARLSSKHKGHLATGSYRTRRRARLFRFITIASFFLVVLLPSVAVTYYYVAIASDQYVSEARFTVRGGMPPKLDSIGTLTGAPSVLIIQDTQIIMNYIGSRSMVEKLEAAVDLRRLYSSDSIDFFSRLKKDAKIEKFLRYWKSMVQMSVQVPAGIVVFQVRAFSADDAARITDAALEASEVLVNRMNDQMINDTLAVSELERQRAEDNLAKTRTNLEKAQNEEGMLSAEKSADALNGLITSVRGDLSKMQTDYDAQSHYVNENAPQMRNLRVRINAASDEITKLKARLTQMPTAEATKTLAGSMSKLEYATLENQIAEKIYASTLALLEHARLASETKLMYINTFVRPVPAQESTYPHRPLDIGLFIGAALAIWASLLGGLNVIKNRLTP